MGVASMKTGHDRDYIYCPPTVDIFTRLGSCLLAKRIRITAPFQINS